MSSDRVILDKNIPLNHGDYKISGPWRLTVYETENDVPIYVFIEEHDNEGSCPTENHISEVVREVIINTTNVHIYIENFIHAYDLLNPRAARTEDLACSPTTKGILNNLRSCLEVMRLNEGSCDKKCQSRIHFIDPRADIVCVFPDGKLFEAITFFCEHEVSKGNFASALLLIYEAFVHPLHGLLPDRQTLKGRLVGTIENLRGMFTDEQRVTFDKMWKQDITQRISNIYKSHVELNKKYVTSNVGSSYGSSFMRDLDKFKVDYKKLTNKFLDLWNLAHVFITSNKQNPSGMILYLGSLHGITIEEYFVEHGYKRVYRKETDNLQSCLKL